MPPEAISRTSLYLPMGVVIAPCNATARPGGRPRISRAFRQVAQGVLYALQLAGKRGRIDGVCAVSLPHRLQLAPGAVDELGGAGDVLLGVVPGEIRAQCGQLGDLRPGEPGQRVGAVHQRRGGAIVALLPRVPRPAPEQIEEPSIERVLLVELGVRGRPL